MDLYLSVSKRKQRKKKKVKSKPSEQEIRKIDSKDKSYTNVL